MPFKFDVRESDPSKAIQGGGEQAPVGMYQAKVVKVTNRAETTNGEKNDLEVIYEITGDANGKALAEPYAVLYDYVNFDVAWKLDQFLQAMGLATSSKRTGQGDENKLKGKKVKLRVKGDTWNGEYRAKVGGTWKLGAGPTAGADDEPDDADDDDDTAAADDTTGSDEETWAEVGARVDTDDPDGEGDEAAALMEAAEEAGVDPDDYPTWEELGAYLDENSGDGDGDGDADGDADGEDVPYTDWSLADLRAECEARELDSTGAKSKLIARLEEADENDGPFD